MSQLLLALLLSGARPIHLSHELSRTRYTATRTHTHSPAYAHSYTSYAHRHTYASFSLRCVRACVLAAARDSYR